MNRTMNKNRLLKYSIPLLLLMFVGIYSCKPKKRILQDERELEDKTHLNLFKDVLHKELKYATFSTKMSMTVFTGKRTLSSKGDLRIIRNEGIQLSIQPLFGIEMFRLYVQPDCIIILDRMNKRYVREYFDDISGELPIGFDFYTLQSLFTNSLFVSDQSSVSANDYKKFKYAQSTQSYKLSAQDRKSNIDYSFYVNGNDQITLAQLYMASKNYGLDWGYDEFTLVEDLFFPLEMKVSATTPKRKLETSFSLSSVSIDEQLTLNSSVPSSYAKVELKEIMKLLANK